MLEDWRLPTFTNHDANMMKTIIFGALFLFFLSNSISGTKLVIETDRLDENNNFIIEESEEALLEEGKWSISCFIWESNEQIIQLYDKQLWPFLSEVHQFISHSLRNFTGLCPNSTAQTHQTNEIWQTRGTWWPYIADLSITVLKDKIVEMS